MTELTTTILLLQVAATWAMVGLIWFVQVVHYPLFAQIGDDGFVAYEQAHQQRTTWVVAPLMLAELATAAWLVVWRPAAIPVELPWLGLALLALIWLLTAAVQVPQHTALAAAYDRTVQRRLVAWNWLRTAAWTGRGLITGAMLWGALGESTAV